jgi:hypothetical protein
MQLLGGFVDVSWNTVENNLGKQNLSIWLREWAQTHCIAEHSYTLENVTVIKMYLLDIKDTTLVSLTVKEQLFLDALFSQQNQLYKQWEINRKLQYNPKVY